MSAWEPLAWGAMVGFVVVSLIGPAIDFERIQLRVYVWRHRNDPPVHMAALVVSSEALRALYQNYRVSRRDWRDIL